MGNLVPLKDIRRATADLFVDRPAKGEVVLPAVEVEPRWRRRPGETPRGGSRKTAEVEEGRWVTLPGAGPVCLPGDPPEGQEGCEPRGGDRDEDDASPDIEAIKRLAPGVDVDIPDADADIYAAPIKNALERMPTDVVDALREEGLLKGIRVMNPKDAVEHIVSRTGWSREAVENGVRDAVAIRVGGVLNEIIFLGVGGKEAAYLEHVMLHELGHAAERLDPDVEERVARLRARKAPPTFAGLRNIKEDWAEAFALYVGVPEWLRKKSPERYELVERFMKDIRKRKGRFAEGRWVTLPGAGPVCLPGEPPEGQEPCEPKGKGEKSFGVEVKELSPDDAGDLYKKLSRKWRPESATPGEGFIVGALGSGNPVLVARQGDEVVGALAYTRGLSPGSIYVTHMGTRGTKGAGLGSSGYQLMKQVARIAAKEGKGLTWTSSKDAEEFWKRTGLPYDDMPDGLEFRMSARQVRAFAKGLNPKKVKGSVRVLHEGRWVTLSGAGRRLTRSMVDVTADDAGLVRIVPLGRLVPRQRREDADPTKMSGLASMFAPGGRIPPLSVARQHDGTYLVLDGNHRLFWAQDVGLDRLPVIPTTPGVVPESVRSRFVK